jgi:hypothetical protein
MRRKQDLAFASQSFGRGARISGASKINDFFPLRMFGCCGLWWWYWDNQCGIDILQRETTNNV